MMIGLLATLLFHALLITLLPENLAGDLENALRPKQEDNSFSIEYAPEDTPVIPPQPEKKAPTKFVEVNPDVPDNEPDKTDNFSSQNQQASQEKDPKETGGDHPEMEGRKDINSVQVVDGSLSEPKPPEPPPSIAQPDAEKPQPEPVKRERNPLPGEEKNMGEDKDAYGSNIAKIAPHPEDIPEKVEGKADAPDDPRQGQQLRMPQVDRNHPRQRPVLDKSRARPAVFAENKFGTSNIGPMAVDARWSNYGQYLQRLFEIVQIQWEKNIDQGGVFPTRGSRVDVKFILNSKGEIAKVVSVESGLAGRQAEAYCVSGITIPAPYGKWTDDMVALLGEEQEMTFAFFYQ